MIPTISQADARTQVARLAANSFLIGCLNYAIHKGETGKAAVDYCKAQSENFYRELLNPRPPANQQLSMAVDPNDPDWIACVSEVPKICPPNMGKLEEVLECRLREIVKCSDRQEQRDNGSESDEEDTLVASMRKFVM